MPHRRTTFSKFIIESLRRTERDPELAALLNDVMTACKLISVAVSRGATEPVRPAGLGAPAEPKALDQLASEIMLNVCEFGGQLCGMVSEELAEPYPIPEGFPRGRYMLLFDALDGASNIDVNMPVGTVFSVLRAEEGVADPMPADFLQPGAKQVAAGYALHGPVSMLVVTLGDGTHGFTLEREIGAYVLTHPRMAIQEATREFAIDASNARFWEPPVRRYVEECTEGLAGPRGADFEMRWIASMVAEVHRILIRGGLFIHPRDRRDEVGRAGLVYVANPLAMLVEQAGGAASTGRRRIVDIPPDALHQHVPVIVGSRGEVERIVEYHAAYDRGEPVAFVSPLFNTRSLFRTG